jgi:hypothetical protein
MSDYYKLDKNRNPVAAKDTADFQNWKNNNDCEVKITTLEVPAIDEGTNEKCFGTIEIATIFNPTPDNNEEGKLMFFQTSVSGDCTFNIVSRTATWADAELSHDNIVEKYRNGGCLPPLRYFNA